MTNLTELIQEKNGVRFTELYKEIKENVKETETTVIEVIVGTERYILSGTYNENKYGRHCGMNLVEYSELENYIDVYKENFIRENSVEQIIANNIISIPNTFLIDIHEGKINFVNRYEITENKVILYTDNLQETEIKKLEVSYEDDELTLKFMEDQINSIIGNEHPEVQRLLLEIHKGGYYTPYKERLRRLELTVIDLNKLEDNSDQDKIKYLKEVIRKRDRLTYALDLIDGVCNRLDLTGEKDKDDKTLKEYRESTKGLKVLEKITKIFASKSEK